jgi:hypothetical protein
MYSGAPDPVLTVLPELMATLPAVLSLI